MNNARRVCLLMLVAVVSMVGCSSSEDSSTTLSPGVNATAPDQGSTTGSEDLGDAEVSMPDACALLDETAVTAAIGRAAEPAPTAESQDPPLVSCVWGEIAKGPVLAVQVSAKGPSGIDTMRLMADQFSDDAVPVEIGQDGTLIDTGLIPGGGGVGYSVIFTSEGRTVVVGVAGEGTEQAAVEAAAQAVATNLG